MIKFIYFCNILKEAYRHKKLQFICYNPNKMIINFLNLLVKEGYILFYETIIINNSDSKQENNSIRIYLKYLDLENNKSVINHFKLFCKPSVHLHLSYTEICKLPVYTGKAIFSTTSGLLTERECRKFRIGGELLCYIN